MLCATETGFWCPVGLLALLHTRLFLTFTFDCWRAGKDENGEGDTCQSTLENEGSSVAERKEEEDWEESCLPSLTKTATENKPSDTIRQEKPANHPQSTYSNTGKNCWLFYWRFVVCFNMLFMAVSSDKMTFFLFICKSIVTVKGKTDANSYLFERVNHSLSVCHPFECLKKSIQSIQQTVRTVCTSVWNMLASVRSIATSVRMVLTSVWMISTSVQTVFSSVHQLIIV